ncbi:MAG: hypothetical protein H7145_09755 [Akkermansiaceae bacterium]|nr:hypothetical protein [Armatimonadota bacterium]
MRIFKLSYCAITLAVMMIGASEARADLFDFEPLAPTFVSPPAAVSTGALTSLILSGPTVDVAISRLNGDRFDLVSNTGNQADKPEPYGLISLDPFFDTDGSWVLNFSTAVTNVSLDFGDYGEDSDNLTLAAFDGADLAGTFLGGSFRSIATTLTQDFTGNTISFGAPGIRSVRLSGSSSVDFDSVYFDNLNVTGAVAVPEANALALLSLVLPVTGIMASRWRKK